MKKHLWPILFLAAFAGLNSCKKAADDTEDTASSYCLNETLKGQIELDTIRLSDVIKSVKLTGEVEFNADRVYPFISLFSGLVTEVGFSVGDKVSKGQLMAEIKSPDLNMLNEERKSLSSQITVAQRELSAVRSMFDDKLASERELLTAQHELQQLESRRAVLNKNYALFNPNSAKGTFQIIAPASGFVIQKDISPGTQISEEMELFTISTLDTIWVMANVYVTDMQHIEAGMLVKIRFPAFPDETYTGKIAGLSPSFDAEERVLKAKIEIPNTGLKLKPGMTADVIVENATDEKALAVPAEEVIFDNNAYYVIVYNTDCDMEIRKILPQMRDNEVYYVSSGLKEGERIITQNQLLIYEELRH